MVRLPKKISVIIPSYNEEKNILPLYKRLIRTLMKITSRYELIYVNNSSTDDSENIIKSIIKRDPSVNLITFSRNFGYQTAITAGMDLADGEAVVVIDGDLQDPPELIEEFVRKWKKGYDVVYGIRKKREGSLFRRICYKLFYRVLRKISYIDMPLDASEFALIDKKIANELKKLPERNRFIRGLRSWVGFRQTGVEYVRQDRKKGVTKFNFFNNMKLGFDGLFSFSEVPLYVITLFGFFCVLLSFVGIIGYFLYFFIRGRIVPGFLTTIMAVLFFGGIQLLSISIVGQYVSRIFEEVKQRPKYIVKEIAGKKKSFNYE